MVGLLKLSKHMGARRRFVPCHFQEYFQQPPLKKPTPTNAVSMTKILTKEPSVS